MLFQFQVLFFALGNEGFIAKIFDNCGTTHQLRLFLHLLQCLPVGLQLTVQETAVKIQGLIVFMVVFKLFIGYGSTDPTFIKPSACQKAGWCTVKNRLQSHLTKVFHGCLYHSLHPQHIDYINCLFNGNILARSSKAPAVALGIGICHFLNGLFRQAVHKSCQLKLIFGNILSIGK